MSHNIYAARSVLPALLLLASTLLVACGDTDSVSASDAAAESSAPTSSGSGALPPLPEAASARGTLPRTYAGITLGDPLPTSSEATDGPPPFYPDATQHLVRLSDSPKTLVSLYAHEGTIFRLEWRVKDASIDRDAVARAFAERLGAPEEPSQYLPQRYVYWNDGLTEGTTTITVFRIDESDWFRVAFEDTGRASQLMSRR